MTDAERIAELEEENAWLRSELGLIQGADRLATVRRTFGLQPGDASLVLALYQAKGSVRNKLQLHEAIPAVWVDHDDRGLKIIDVRICRLRKRLGHDAIETLWGQGYRLTAEGIAKVSEALDPVHLQPSSATHAATTRGPQPLEHT